MRELSDEYCIVSIKESQPVVKMHEGSLGKQMKDKRDEGSMLL